MAELGFADGVLFFPVTAFDGKDRVDSEVVEQHIATGVEHGPGAVFAACGTGEYHALGFDEYEIVVRAAVRATAGRVPVVAGVGGPLGQAVACARIAERAGARALLVLPPYLVQGPQEGLVAYVQAIAAASLLPVIVYHRGTAKFSTASIARLLEDERVAGIKDGVGDVALAQEFVLTARRSGRSDVLFFNGLLTAELSQAAYAAIGVPLYSSAVFAMAPDIATAFYRAYREGDQEIQARLLDGFYAPLVRLRDETPGFAVALIKAGLRLRGVDVGPVRAPLVDPNPDQLERLRGLLEQGRALIA
ncbi:5-dehydro-4-deoxyglucarate dehydratase [Naasia sp. SYSU D00948]|uniref:5-dehydro-4-deoxyglucarate dehydratase n=1 Tax=Naasia sp. SYSU D00948 TaxID=2817379 RepID=UPI001B300CD5|nr:5-dehydro-4-deoxyglucarate dehydratase [Naasia sp. SYSU D00948]